MKWIVSGTWDLDSKPGRLTVQAESMRGALDSAKTQGLSGFEAIVAGQQPGAASTTVTSTRRRRLGLSRGEAWAVIAVGLLLSPVVVGIPLIVWGVLGLRQLGEG